MSMLKIRPETEVLAEISGYLSAYIQGRLAFKLFRRTGNPVVCPYAPEIEAEISSITNERMHGWQDGYLSEQIAMGLPQIESTDKA
ncbi:MAG: hypothetical protein U0989_17470 [Azonexus sp.]|nr:hypothetical protein [Azonexus sp.]MDZ4316544.1 hypothetical protein [Azonexus sp.]